MRQFVNESPGPRAPSGASNPDIVCFGRPRWGEPPRSATQRLLSQLSTGRRIFFVEEPVSTEEPVARLRRYQALDGVTIAVPELPATELASPQLTRMTQSRLVDGLLRENSMNEYILWFSDPAALAFTAHLQPRAVVCDCLDDEVSPARRSPRRSSPDLQACRELLMAQADLILTVEDEGERVRWGDDQAVRHRVVPTEPWEQTAAGVLAALQTVPVRSVGAAAGVEGDRSNPGRVGA